VIARWLDVVLRASGQDGATAAAADLEAEAALLCEEGIAAACTYASWGSPFSPAAAYAALAPECDRGDAVSCLVSGWARGQEPWGTWSQRLPTAVEARLKLERACELDLARGCVEVARALFHGVGSTARPNKARERLALLCRAKEGSACGTLGVVTIDPGKRRDLFARAVDLDFVPALRELALMSESDALTFHEAACLTGVGASCRDLASLDAARRHTALETGCHVQHVGSCTDLAVLRIAEGDEKGGLSALDALCDEQGAVEACARAEMIRLGDPPRPHVPGTLSPLDRELLDTSLEERVWSCYVARVGRGEVSGQLSLFVAVAPDGRIEGAAGVGPFVDQPLQQCLNDGARRADPTPPPAGGPALVRYDLFLAHHATVSFRPEDMSKLMAEELAVTDELARLGPEFERCALLEPDETAPIAIDVVIKRRGRVVVVGIPRSSEVVAVDACMTEVLEGARIEAAVYRMEGLVLVGFLQAALRSGDPEDR